MNKEDKKILIDVFKKIAIFGESKNNWLSTEIPQYGGIEREYKTFDTLEEAIEECENLC